MRKKRVYSPKNLAFNVKQSPGHALPLETISSGKMRILVTLATMMGLSVQELMHRFKLS